MRMTQDIERWPIVQSFALEECGRGGATIAISLLMLRIASRRRFLTGPDEVVVFARTEDHGVSASPRRSAPPAGLAKA
jgi:hypothetical protein